jgi:hypothetical protein
MSDRVQCFFLRPTGVIRRSLRRYVSGASGCAGGGYHNAVEFLDVQPVVWDDPRVGRLSARTRNREASEPRRGRAVGNVYDPEAFPFTLYPKACACGYEFTDSDTRQVFVELVYRADAGRVLPGRAAPAGAMWDADWLPSNFEGPDGIALVVKLPDGTEWPVDGPSNQSPRGWQRTGLVPNIAARPSILTDGYHGFLGGVDGSSPGVLVRC